MQQLKLRVYSAASANGRLYRSNYGPHGRRVALTTSQKSCWLKGQVLIHLSSGEHEPPEAADAALEGQDIPHSTSCPGCFGFRALPEQRTQKGKIRRAAEAVWTEKDAAAAHVPDVAVLSWQRLQTTLHVLAHLTPACTAQRVCGCRRRKWE